MEHGANPFAGIPGLKRMSGGEDEDEEEFDVCGQECFEFNGQLERKMDDGCCEHCRKYYTTKCPHIDVFMDEL